MGSKEQIQVAAREVLERTIMRRRQAGMQELSVDMGDVIGDIVRWASRFVPSEAGSVLLDDPILKMDSAIEGKLYFAACFGTGASALAGTSIADNEGIAGQTYMSGMPYISEDVSQDEQFLARIDSQTSYTTRSVICAPIKINDSIIGVIELVNRIGNDNYDMNDMLLLEIFAGYTAQLMEKALAAREFETLSQQDNLTGLHNDRHFLKRLKQEAERAIEHGGDVSLIFFDLDHFKEINDTHGHLVGSRVLAEVGFIMREVFLYSDSAIMARYGGDEYAVILPRTTMQEAELKAQRLRVELESFTFIAQADDNSKEALNISGVITASIGIASFAENVLPDRQPEIMAEALLRAADIAMYQSKEEGKNRVSRAETKY